MDEEKLQKKIAAKEEELNDLKETLQLHREKMKFQEQTAAQKVEQIQEATIKTKEESKKECRICAHPELQTIDSELRKIEEEKGSSKPVRDKYGFSPREIADHTQHW